MSISENKVASYAIIGFGNIGKALAKAFARNGIEISVATTRDPESRGRHRTRDHSDNTGRSRQGGRHLFGCAF